MITKSTTIKRQAAKEITSVIAFLGVTLVLPELTVLVVVLGGEVVLGLG